MHLRKSIVVGYDESEDSRAAVREAARLAASNNAKLLVLEVLPAQLVAEVVRETTVDTEDILAARGLRLLHHVESILAPEPLEKRVETRVSMGQPFSELIDACWAQDADLLVLGATGMTGVAHSAIGAVARSTVRHAPCDTLLMRPGDGDEFKSVVCGIDFSDFSALALQRAESIAAADGARLVLLTAFTKDWLRYAREHAEEGDLPESLSDDHRDQLIAELAEFASEHLEDTNGLNLVVAAVEAVSPAVGLSDYARSVDADLMVIGTKGRSIDDVRPLGSTAEHVISSAHCSVLAVRPDRK